jgi:predicted ATP-dependent endonuclease of OLD family
MSVLERDKMFNQYNEMVRQLKEGGTKINTNDLQTLFDLIVSRNYNQSQFIIEEPEQNLFPTTQRDLIYYMLRVLNESKQNHRLTFTTHSPYILYALNNCMMGYLIKGNMPESEQAELLSNKSWINPNFVSVWEIEQSTIRPIKNSKTGTISKHFFNGIMNDVMEEYYDMLTYLKIENNEE